MDTKDYSEGWARVGIDTEEYALGFGRLGIEEDYVAFYCLRRKSFNLSFKYLILMF